MARRVKQRVFDMMTTRASALLSLPLMFSIPIIVPGCAGDLGGIEGLEGTDEEGHDHVEPEDEVVYSEQAVAAELTPRSATGYKSGTPFTITVVTIDGKDVERATAHQYLRMKAAAANDGVYLRVVSGFRTQAKQAELYRAYQNGTGNLAARPGYSNHQSGHALDLNASATGVYSWLSRNGARFGFKRTVPSENWHWEFWGPDPGPPGGMTTPTPTKTPTPTPTPSPTGASCQSATLAKVVAAGTCVQAASDRAWYQCRDGSWMAGRTNCSASYAWCSSSTLGREVAPRTCVQSRSDRVWYQCTASGWTGGVANGAGSLGTCSAMHEL